MVGFRCVRSVKIARGMLIVDTFGFSWRGTRDARIAPVIRRTPRLLVLVLGALSISSPVTAQQGMTERECSVHQAATDIGLGDTNGYISNLSERFKLLEEMRELNNKGTDPNKPIGEQLSARDRQRFDAVRQRLGFLMGIAWIEDEHYRYSRIIEKIWQIAEARYHQRYDPTEGNEGYNYQSLLDLIRARFPTTPQILNGIVQPTDANCTIEMALFLNEREALNQLPQFYKLASDQGRELNLIRSQHHLPPNGPIDDKILSPTERSTAAHWATVLPELLVTMDRTLVFIGDVEHLRGLSIASEIIYRENKGDWIKSGGDPDLIGKTIQRTAYDPNTRAMITIWDNIADRAPTAEQIRHQDRAANTSLK
jgi:hypothetical protein